MVLTARKQAGIACAAFLFYVVCVHILRSVARPSRVRKYLTQLPEVPTLSLDYGIVESAYNESKVALLIENRPQGMIAPMILHFMAVLPPDWRFRFMGSDESVAHVNKSAAIRRQVSAGKLDLTYIPHNMSVNGQEEISRFLTTLWLYDTVLQPAEWLLIYQTDSMMCANHKGTLDDWLKYDWVGAPWGMGDRYGGNGGLSLRRVSSMIQILQHQQRLDDSEPEDVWWTERLGHLPNSKTANGTMSNMFSAEGIWYDEPLGYHTGGGGNMLPGGTWGDPERRQHIYDYCPEMKMTLDMDLRKYMPEQLCSEHW